MIRLTLAWPARPLWKNYNGPKWRTAKSVAAQRREGWALATEWGVKKLGLVRPLLRVKWHPPDNRKRDLHNMPITIAGAIDGIQDALGIDDNSFLVLWPTEFGSTVKRGAVVIDVEETPSVVDVPLRGVIT